MQVAADTVVFLTGLPIAGGLIIDGLASVRPAEVGAGLVLAMILGVPSLATGIRSLIRRRAG